MNLKLLLQYRIDDLRLSINEASISNKLKRFPPKLIDCLAKINNEFGLQILAYVNSKNYVVDLTYPVPCLVT